MKSIYLKIIELLKTVTSLQFIDLDKGQLDYYDMRPNVAFPAALINLSVQNMLEETVLSQRVKATLSIRVAFDYTGETSGSTPDDVRTASLAYFDVLDEIFAALQGYTDANLDLISRVSVSNEYRQDGLKICVLQYEIWYDEFEE